MGEPPKNPPMPDEQPSTNNDTGMYQRSGKITFCLEKASDFIGTNKVEELDEFPVSQPTYINGLPWILAYRMMNKRTFLAIIVICCGDPNDKAWSCSAIVKISLFSTALGRNIKQDESRHTFNPEISHSHFIDIKELTDPELQFIDLKEDTITAIAEIVAEEPRGIREIRNDNLLKVNGIPVNVNKYNLAAYSNYFRTLFFGHNAAEDPAILIDDMTDGVKHFKRMISTMCPENKELDEDCIESVLHLANRFLVNTVENRCVQFLVEKSKKLAISKYRLADKYGFTALKAHVLESLEAEDFAAKNYEKNLAEQSQLSEEANKELMERYRELFPPEEPPAKRAKT